MKDIGLGFKLGFVPTFHLPVSGVCSPFPVPRFSNVHTLATRFGFPVFRKLTSHACDKLVPFMLAFANTTRVTLSSTNLI